MFQTELDVIFKNTEFKIFNRLSSRKTINVKNWKQLFLFYGIYDQLIQNNNYSYSQVFKSRKIFQKFPRGYQFNMNVTTKEI